MTGSKDVSQSKLVDFAALELKRQNLVQMPSWVLQVKSSVSNERVPEDKDFWFKRCAAVLRSVYFREAGVRRLRRKFGGRQEHRVVRAHHAPAGGKAIRLAMQQLEKSGLLKTVKGKGRQVTAKGKSFLDKVAARIEKAV